MCFLFHIHFCYYSGMMKVRRRIESILMKWIKIARKRNNNDDNDVGEIMNDDATCKDDLNSKFYAVPAVFRMKLIVSSLHNNQKHETLLHDKLKREIPSIQKRYMVLHMSFSHTRSHPHIHLSELLIVKMNNETHLEQRQLKLLHAAPLHFSSISSPLIHTRSTQIHLAKLHPLPLMMLPSLMIKKGILTRF